MWSSYCLAVPKSRATRVNVCQNRTFWQILTFIEIFSQKSTSMLCSEDHSLAEEELLRKAWPGAAIFLALADTDFQVLSGDFLEELSTSCHHPPQEELLSAHDSPSPPPNHPRGCTSSELRGGRHLTGQGTWWMLNRSSLPAAKARHATYLIQSLKSKSNNSNSFFFPPFTPKVIIWPPYAK